MTNKYWPIKNNKKNCFWLINFESEYNLNNLPPTKQPNKNGTINSIGFLRITNKYDLLEELSMIISTSRFVDSVVFKISSDSVLLAFSISEISRIFNYY